MTAVIGSSRYFVLSCTIDMCSGLISDIHAYAFFRGGGLYVRSCIPKSLLTRYFINHLENFAKVASLVYLGTKMKILGFEVKRSKVKVMTRLNMVIYIDGSISSSDVYCKVSKINLVFDHLFNMFRSNCYRQNSKL